jgi:hypothetical protein
MEARDMTRSERSTEQHEQVLQEALNIFKQRSTVRGDLWAQFDLNDALHHCRDKLARCEAYASALQGPPRDFPTPERDQFTEAMKDDLLDLINYTVFTYRHLTGAKPVPMVD